MERRVEVGCRLTFSTNNFWEGSDNVSGHTQPKKLPQANIFMDLKGIAKYRTSS